VHERCRCVVVFHARAGSVLTRPLTQDKGAFQRVVPLRDGDNTCGVGIKFKLDVTGALEVHSVVPSSPDVADTQIKQGDLLCEVNDSTVTALPGEPPQCIAGPVMVTVAAGPTAACSDNSMLMGGVADAFDAGAQVDRNNVFRFPMKQVAEMLLGPAGTLVSLTFQRRPAAGQPFVRIHTVLRRDVRALRASHEQHEEVLKLSLSPSLSESLARSRALSLSRSLSLSLSRARALSLAHTLSRSRSFSLSLSLSVTLFMSLSMISGWRDERGWFHGASASVLLRAKDDQRSLTHTPLEENADFSHLLACVGFAHRRRRWKLIQRPRPCTGCNR